MTLHPKIIIFPTVASQKQCIFIVVFLTATIVSTTTSRAVPMREMHEKWMSDNGRVYSNATEKEARYNIFKANVHYIHSVNGAGDKPYKLGINQYADITTKEFKSTYTTPYHKPLPTKPPRETTFRYQNSTDVPPSIDWRNKGAVTGIRSGQCGKHPSLYMNDLIKFIYKSSVYYDK